jgi:hypothetical protein
MYLSVTWVRLIQDADRIQIVPSSPTAKLGADKSEDTKSESQEEKATEEKSVATTSQADTNVA